MPTYYYVALTRAVRDRTEEFHRWYDNRHIQDCLRVPGVKSVKRYRLLYNPGTAKSPIVSDCDHDSLCIYELEGDDPVSVAREFGARAGTAAMPLTDALDRGALAVYIAQDTGKNGGE